MKLGSNDISSVYLGTNGVSKVYLGSTEVWSSFTGLLDTYTGAAAAYSLRLLRTAYTGSAIKVRRASDNTEQDIGFSNNELDTTTLASFCSGTNGFVTTWYDQSGNGYNGTQATAASQPKIYDSSTGVVTENGKPTILNDNIDDYIRQSVPNDFFGTNDIFVFCVNKSNSNSETGGLFQKRNGFLDGNFGVGLVSGRYQIQARDSGTGDAVLNSSSTYNTQQLFSASRNSSGLNMYSPEILSLSSSVADLTSTGVFDIFNGSSYGSFDGNIQEIVIYTSNQSTNRSGIETNINDFYSIY